MNICVLKRNTKSYLIFASPADERAETNLRKVAATLRYFWKIGVVLYTRFENLWKNEEKEIRDTIRIVSQGSHLVYAYQVPPLGLAPLWRAILVSVSTGGG